jgi:anthranilate synthase component 1
LIINFSPKLPAGSIDLSTHHFGPKLKISSMSSDEYKEAVLQAKEHILAGDIFQIVLSQRFERRTFADPFEVYRALRIVNPSPYMTYLQVCLLSPITICMKTLVNVENLTFSCLCPMIRSEEVSWLLQAQKFLPV